MPAAQLGGDRYLAISFNWSKLEAEHFIIGLVKSAVGRFVRNSRNGRRFVAHHKTAPVDELNHVKHRHALRGLRMLLFLFDQ